MGRSSPLDKDLRALKVKMGMKLFFPLSVLGDGTEGPCIYYNGSQYDWAESRPGQCVCGLWCGVVWKVPQGSPCLETEMDCC